MNSSHSCAATVTEASETMIKKEFSSGVLQGGAVSSQQSVDSYDYGAPIDMVRLGQCLVADDVSLQSEMDEDGFSCGYDSGVIGMGSCFGNNDAPHASSTPVNEPDRLPLTTISVHVSAGDVEQAERTPQASKTSVRVVLLTSFSRVFLSFAEHCACGGELYIRRR